MRHLAALVFFLGSLALAACAVKPTADIKGSVDIAPGAVQVAPGAVQIAPITVAAPAPIAPLPVAAVAQCPVLHEFDPAQQKALAEALRALPAGSIWHDVAEDDQKMRAQTRACIAAKKAE